jgi:MFS family permease
MQTQNPAPLLKAFFVLTITSLLFLYEFSLGNIYNSFGSYIGSEFHLSPAQLGFVASLYFYTDLLFLIPAGIIVDRYSPRKVITLILLISSSGVLLTAFSHSLITLVIFRLLMGFGGGFCLVGCIRIAVNWFSPTYLARATGFIITMGMLGGLLVQAPLTILIHHVGWREAMAVIGLVGYGCMLLIFLLVRDTPDAHAHTAQHLKNQHIAAGIAHCLKLALLKKQNWFCGLYTSLMNLPIFMLGALWGIPYLTSVHHLSMTDAATISGMLYLGSMIGSPLLGFCSDVLKRRRLTMQVGAVISIILILLVMQNAPSNFWTLLSLFLALGIITSSQVVSYPTVVESNSRMVSSSATAVISMMCMGGGALIQPLFGYLLSYKGGAEKTAGILSYPATNYEFAMISLPIAFLIALIFTFFIKETHCKNIHQEDSTS